MNYFSTNQLIVNNKKKPNAHKIVEGNISKQYSRYHLCMLTIVMMQMVFGLNILKNLRWHQIIYKTILMKVQ